MTISSLHPLSQIIAQYMAFDASDAELATLAADPGLVGECAQGELETRDQDDDDDDHNDDDHENR